jgi:hypothetical protein
MTPCPLTHFVFCRRDKHDGLPRLRLVARCLSNARASDRLTLDAGYARAARDRFAAGQAAGERVRRQCANTRFAGHFVFGDPWRQLWAEYNVFRGRLWSLVPLMTVLAPVITSSSHRAG